MWEFVGGLTVDCALELILQIFEFIRNIWIEYGGFFFIPVCHNVSSKKEKCDFFLKVHERNCHISVKAEYKFCVKSWFVHIMFT